MLVQKSGHVDDDVQISALDAFYEMDGRKSRYIGEVLDWNRGEERCVPFCRRQAQDALRHGKLFGDAAVLGSPL